MLETDQCLMSSASVPDIFYDEDTLVTQFETQRINALPSFLKTYGEYILGQITFVSSA